MPTRRFSVFKIVVMVVMVALIAGMSVASPTPWITAVLGAIGWCIGTLGANVANQMRRKRDGR